MKLAITIVATKNYTYAMKDQAARVQGSLGYCKISDPIIILITDQSGEMDSISSLYKNLLPDAMIIQKDMAELNESANYKIPAQLLISKMRTAAFNEARRHDVDFCLSLDSDVLPAINGIQTCLDMLSFDKGYYDVACILYTSQGGGPWLCGRGTTQHQILPDFYEDERNVPKRYIKFKKIHEEEMTKVDNKESAEKIHKKLEWVRKRIEKYPPKSDVFGSNSIKWRKRGWFDNAYPAIGKGACVPTDWCGFGATMMNRRALAHAHFDGYQGAGTEDLYVCFHKWKPNGIKLVAIPHSLCDHIVRSRREPGTFTHVHGYHEESGEFEGHIRQRWTPYISQY